MIWEPYRELTQVVYEQELKIGKHVFVNGGDYKDDKKTSSGFRELTLLPSTATSKLSLNDLHH